MMYAGTISCDDDLGQSCEVYFRLGIAVHRAECLLAEFREVISRIPSEGGVRVDLVDTALLGCTCAEARVPTLMVLVFGLTFTAIDLWRDFGFADTAVELVLRDREIERRCQASRDAIFYGDGLISEEMIIIAADVERHLNWAAALLSAMRGHLMRFGKIHFLEAPIDCALR